MDHTGVVGSNGVQLGNRRHRRVPVFRLSSLPVGWSLDGVLTNITYVNITQPAVFTVTCTAGASAATNYIAATLNGDVEADYSGDGLAFVRLLEL